MGAAPEVADPWSSLRHTLERTNTWYTMASGLVSGARSLYAHWREHSTFTVSVSSADPGYQDVHDWLVNAVPPARRRALMVCSGQPYADSSDAVPASDSPPTASAPVRLAYDSGHEQTVLVSGRAVRVALARGEDDSAGSGGMRRVPPDRIVFRCPSQAAQQAVIDHLITIIGDRSNRRRTPQLHVLSSWGGWTRRSDIPPRSLESVVLRAGQMEELISDLGEFLSAETEYIRRGQPWHYGCLLQGPPGTGKTSIVKALASHFGLDLWHVPLGDLISDTSLSTLLAQVHPRSMLLLEDVDIYAAATSRKAEAEQVSLSGLLNALDGVITPHGLIIVLTSNEPASLDPALVRPGRIDRVENVDHLTDEQAHRLFVTFYQQPARLTWTIAPETASAAVIGVFKHHLRDPDAAERALCRALAHQPPLPVPV